VQPQIAVGLDPRADVSLASVDEGKHARTIGVERLDDDAIRSPLTRLGRAPPSGGIVSERAAIHAEGADVDAREAWIVAHGGGREARAPGASSSDLHGSRVHDGGRTEPRPRSRYGLPAGAPR
jgi:hypothetical protein